MRFEELRPLIWDVLVQAGRTLTLGEIQTELPYLPHDQVQASLYEMCRNPVPGFLVLVSREGKRQGRPDWDMPVYCAFHGVKQG